jgi:outer membrane protein assembly factor BamB
MKTMRPMNLVLSGGIIVLVLIGFIVPDSLLAATPYPEDGVWEDSFDDTTNLALKNCEVKNKEIVLKQEDSEQQYDFRLQSNHDFYVYTTYFFIPSTRLFSPETHLERESQLGGRDVDNIKTINKIYTSRTSFLVRRVIVHHFRFQVNLDEETAENVVLKWYGKADSSAVIKFYYWNSSRFPNGGWHELGTNVSTGADFHVNGRYYIPGGAVKYAKDSENFIDISVVAYFPLMLKSCTLSTDYVGLFAQTKMGYSLNYGAAKTKFIIEPKKISPTFKTFYWELLAWDDSQQAGTKVRYQVLYENETGVELLVENETLPGNAQGFTNSPVPLYNLSRDEYLTKYDKLKIRANLTTESSSFTPRIFNWALTWQNGTRWQDSFNTYNRLDRREKIFIENGTIKISQVQDEWPVFGFNSENTRATDGKGAQTGNLYWYGREFVGGGFRNPVIGNGMVYIFSNERTLHRYPITLPSGNAEGSSQKNYSSVKMNFDCVNSPAITDEYVIVATGEQGSKGHENHIFGFELDNLTQVWNFTYNKYICYDASPVVVDDILYISTWGGDNRNLLVEANRYTNNKLIALNLKDLTYWEFPLPASGLSTPAVSGDIIIVTCNSTNANNDSVFAVALDGVKIWSKHVGAIAHASPVVSDDTVFVTYKYEETNRKASTRIVALDLNTGEYIWNTTIGALLSTSYTHFAESTPAVHGNVLYAASPDGTIYALDTGNGTILWYKSVYTLSGSNLLRSSPAYADNTLYIGTPEGKIVALNATTGTVVWEASTFTGAYDKAPVYGSPSVSNGLVYIADEYECLYSFGRFIASTNQIGGSVVSVPIRLPEAYWWGNFYVDVSYKSNISKIKFKLLDENGNILRDDLTNKTSLPSVGPTLGRAVRLRADLSSDNISRDNPKLLRWYVTLTIDSVNPHLISSTFTPDSQGWLPEIVPSFSIQVKDNLTGLRVSTAKYTLEYTLNNVSQKSVHQAFCSGNNGTTQQETMTMNISQLSFYENITSLTKITFNISDMAGNEVSKTVTFKQDTKKPTSRIRTLSMKDRYNSTYIMINATSNDTGTLNVDASGVKFVQLYYRYSEDSNFSDAGDWILFANSTKKDPTWYFNFSDDPNQPGGYFELCSIATDYAGHVEDVPSSGDVSFLYDWTRPYPPDVSGETLWFKERPRFSVVFEDDYRLDTIQYSPNFETTWTTIARNVNASIYDTEDPGHSWVLKQEYWDQMAEGEVYYLYFKINDTLNNTLVVTSNNQAIIIRKDTAQPIISVDAPSLETEWSLDKNFTIMGLGTDPQGSGIKEALLYYRFSADNSNWSDWDSYGDSLDASPFEWMFNADEGDGYYQVKINVTDYAGNARDSETIDIVVISFPMTLVLVMLGLVIVLLLISSVIFIKWRKKKTT